jgi:hypothetical protein
MTVWFGLLLIIGRIKLMSRNFHEDPCCGRKARGGDSIEFKYDERIVPGLLPVPITPESIALLAVDFSKVHAGDRVWLSGVISLNNNNALTNAALLTITRQSPISAAPQTIFSQTFELSQEGSDDITQIPFSFVDVPLTQLFDARYTVRLTAGSAELFVSGPITLTAQRIGRA